MKLEAIAKEEALKLALEGRLHATIVHLKTGQHTFDLNMVANPLLE